MRDLPQAVDRTVLDFEGHRVGVVRAVVRDPRTGEAQSLVVGLSPEARAILGNGAVTTSLPMGFVASVRREELSLDRSIAQVARGRAMPPAQG
jgi:sporulation protein YlmC with PRC-barrel domain